MQSYSDYLAQKNFLTSCVNGNCVNGISSVSGTSAKTFVIDHPIDENNYLVHACLEGPESGVYYRGTGFIKDDLSTTICLPDYVEKLTTNLTVQITPIYNGKIKVYNTSSIKNNKFTVYGENGEFYWLVHGSRGRIEVEPDKNSVVVKGDGPYKWF